MKKFLCLVFALATVFCFAGCENGKCDECGAKKDSVKVYEKLDNQELCPECAVKAGYNALGDAIFGE
jgi:rubredoxin